MSINISMNALKSDAKKRSMAYQYSTWLQQETGIRTC